MAFLTQKCPFGAITISNVRNWFSNGSVPRKCHLDAIEGEIKKSGFKSAARISADNNPKISAEIKFMLHEFSIKKTKVSEILGVEDMLVNQWLSRYFEEKPTDNQLKLLRKTLLKEKNES